MMRTAVMDNGKVEEDKLRKWKKQKRESADAIAKYAEIRRAVQEVVDHIRRQTPK